MANSDEKDGFKTTLILSLVLAVLALMLLNTIWPRQTSLSAESMQGINQVAESMKQSAANWEKIAKSTTELHEVLLAQAQGSRNEINMLHKQLLGRYGLDANDPFNDYVNSMLEQSDGYGGGNVPGSKGGAGPDRSLQEADDWAKVKAHGSSAGVVDYSNSTASQPPK